MGPFGLLRFPEMRLSRAVCAAALLCCLAATGAEAQKQRVQSANVEANPPYTTEHDTDSVKRWIDEHLEDWGLLTYWDADMAAFVLPDIDLSSPPVVIAKIRMETTSQSAASRIGARSIVTLVAVNCATRSGQTKGFIAFPGSNEQGEASPFQPETDTAWKPFLNPRSLLGGVEKTLCTRS